MPDPIDALENFDPGAPMDPLPASEVRRRGDRRRRRRTALAGVGAAAAVAALVVPLALLGNDETRTLPPTDGSGTTWLQTVPDSVDVVAGMAPNDTGDPIEEVRGGEGVSLVDFCETGASPFADDGRVDAVAASASGPEYGDVHEVVLYPDDRGAQDVLDELTTTARDCPSKRSGGGSVTLTEVRPWAAGADGVAVVRTYEQDGLPTLGAQILHFTRVGNALLATSTTGEWDPTSNVDLGVAQHEAELAPLVEQLAVFAPDAATPEPDDGDTLTDAALLAADQVPARERLTAWEQLPPVTAPTLVCQDGPLERLGADAIVRREFGAAIAEGADLPGGGGISSQVNTAVLQFADADAVAEAYEAVQGALAACNADVVGLAPLRGSYPIGTTGSWRTWTYAATDVCIECDLVRFDRMGAAVVGDRLVLVSFAEVGGPLEPEGLDATMRALVDVAVAQASS